MSDVERGVAEARNKKRTMLFMSDDNPIWGLVQQLERRVGRHVRAVPLSAAKRSRSAPETRTASRSAALALGDPSFVASKPYEMLAISRTLFDEWKSGRVERGSSVQAQIESLRQSLLAVGAVAGDDGPHQQALGIADTLSRFLVTLSQIGPVQTSARSLGMEGDRARIALDKAFDREQPMFRMPYFADEAAARAELNNIRGHHLVWLQRDKLFLQCTLRIRYAVELTGGHAIRAKLNIPIIRPTSDLVAQSGRLGRPIPHTEYDGWLMCSQASRLFFAFETRQGQSSRSDFVFVIVENWPQDGHWRSGRYLTAGQENAQQVASDTLVMRQVLEPQGDADGESDRITFMRQELQIIRPEHPEHAGLTARADAQAAKETV